MCVFSLLRSLLDEALSREEFFHAAISMHLLDYVAAADQLPLHVQLRECGPVRPFLHRLSQLLVGKNVHILVVVDAVELEDLHNVVAEATPRHLSGTFHEKDCVVGGDPLGELLIQLLFIERGLLGLGLEITVAFFSVIMVVVVPGMESSLGLKKRRHCLEISELGGRSQKERRGLKQTGFL